MTTHGDIGSTWPSGYNGPYVLSGPNKPNGHESRPNLINTPFFPNLLFFLDLQFTPKFPNVPFFLGVPFLLDLLFARIVPMSSLSRMSHMSWFLFLEVPFYPDMLQHSDKGPRKCPMSFCMHLRGPSRHVLEVFGAEQAQKTHWARKSDRARRAQWAQTAQLDNQAERPHRLTLNFWIYEVLCIYHVFGL